MRLIGNHRLKDFMFTNRAPISSRRYTLVAELLLFSLLLFSSPAVAAEVLIVGDIQYKPVAEMVSEIKSTLRWQVKEYAIGDVRGKLDGIVERENARIVVTLGMDAVGEAFRLPPSIAVVYGLVIAPPKSARSNVTGVYMSTPASEYVATVRKYLPSIKWVSVVGSQNLMNVLLGSAPPQVAAYHVGSSSDLVNTVSRLNNAEALLLLPDVNLLTSSVMENVYLFSFRNNVPLLGISEGNVKQGSLLALVFDPKTVSRQIGEKVQNILKGTAAADIPPSPPRKFNLFINTNTARKMGIEIPDEMLKKARRIYQ
jgi:putative tryptophan/tyrosine transport system substrate-binding protein